MLQFQFSKVMTQKRTTFSSTLSPHAKIQMIASQPNALTYHKPWHSIRQSSLDLLHKDQFFFLDYYIFGTIIIRDNLKTEDKNLDLMTKTNTREHTETNEKSTNYFEQNFHIFSQMFNTTEDNS